MSLGSHQLFYIAPLTGASTCPASPSSTRTCLRVAQTCAEVRFELQGWWKPSWGLLQRTRATCWALNRHLPSSLWTAELRWW